MHNLCPNIIKCLSKKKGRNIFVLDKNFVPEKLREVIFGAARKYFKKVNSFLIVPAQSELAEFKIEVEDKINPFYLDTLSVSLVRSFSRKGHKSLCHGYSHSLKSIVGTLRSYAGVNFNEIAERYGMNILKFNYFNVESLLDDSVKDDLLRKMTSIYHLILKKDYDGDKCAELLFGNSEIAKRICAYESHDQEYARIAEEVKYCN